MGHYQEEYGGALQVAADWPVKGFGDGLGAIHSSEFCAPLVVAGLRILSQRQNEVLHDHSIVRPGITHPAVGLEDQLNCFSQVLF